MESKYIAAIEIGSSKIKGIVAAVDPTAAIEVLAIESADAGAGVRYGRVQNAREVTTRVNDIMRRLENNPRLAGGQITSVFVAEGGRSVSSTRSEATVSQGGEAEITTQTLDRLRRDAVFNLATGRDVLEVASRRYLVDNAEVKKIIGAFGRVIKGEFTIVTASPENRRSLDRVKIESRGIDLPRKYIARAIALADTILSDSDRQLGCLMVDFGAETTTIAVYRDNALQMLSTLPMGSSNINHDLCAGLSMTEESAENIKLAKGEAVVERIQLNAPDEETREVINYVSARVGEIIANIHHQVELAGFKSQDLAAGIIVTGGGARLKGVVEMLEAQTKMKVRHAEMAAGIKMPGSAIADNIDVLSLVRYIASHFDTNCVEMPLAVKPQTSTVDQTQTTPTVQTTTYVSQPRRRNIAEDDTALLDDDPDDNDQPINVIDDQDLPEPESDSKKTRESLLAKLKKLFPSGSADKIDDPDLDD